MNEEVRDLRCQGIYQGRTCNRKIGEADIPPSGVVKITCPRCGHLNYFRHERPPARPEDWPRFTDGMVRKSE